ncbi:NAD(P)H-hydrate dehydratase [Actinophytocola xanthii]|uniref:Bifunctional NAD(P)H-hydrate repair enzyme n=1 Tax=Actinophytocola xanthii TaxID=1912961 RepID=A0A1Q8CDP2_9PSEU|nr:NAD(P)H-hydrate dehydratase [Actinophytocola xanthii]OLF12487.1 NAD(P)H-hydrate dehydratase [Actinophytocola xanthii]
MYGVWTVEQIRTAEDRLLAVTPDGALIRRAAFGVATHALALLRERTGGVAGRRVVLLVGSGNNGGDALWAGYYLRKRSVAVTALLLRADRAHPEGLAALRRAGGRTVEVPAEGADAEALVSGADLVVDGIVGLSAHGSLRGAAPALVAAVRAPVLAVDLPSGVDPDTGAVEGDAVRASVTVTFGGRKPVHVLGRGPARCGEVRLVDLGLDLPEPELRVLEAADVGRRWRMPGPDDDKYTQGVTGIAAGSSTYPGAAVLACGSAVRATSGMVRYAGWAADEVRSRWPEVVATGSVEDAGRVQAWVVGPGLGTGQAGRDVLAAVFDDGVPTCVDADGISLLAKYPELWDRRDPDAAVVLTPHDREFARLGEPLGVELGPDRVAAARALAARTNSVVLLKGNATVVADQDGRVLVNPARSSWLATAGSGDVLTGLVGSLLAAGEDPLFAAACASWVHVRAGELAADGAPISAADVLGTIPAAVREAVLAAGRRPPLHRPEGATALCDDEPRHG